MLYSFKKQWQERPLMLLLIIAFAPRLLATIFSKGYAMHDDHFTPIEGQWQMLRDPSIWANRGFPAGHNIVYPSLHYFLFYILEAVGITDSQTKMTIVRLIHAIYSLLTVYFTYKILYECSTKEIARRGALLVGLLWFMPFLSVRNLIEMVSIPPIMAGMYFTIKKNELTKNFLIAGLFYGLAFIFRYQTVLIGGMVFLVLLAQRRVKFATLIAAGMAISIFVFQGLVDWYAWDAPFAAVVEYFRYNATHGNDYITGSWEKYILLVTGVLIPPVSIMLLFGWLRNWRKMVILFLPLLLFFVFHSAFPNKQERFILPIIPALIVLGIAGWEEFRADSAFFEKHKGMLRGIWIWFWVVNTLLLVVFTFTYTKKTRVESMYYLSQKGDLHSLIVVGGNIGENFPPLYYLDKYPMPVFAIETDYTPIEVEIDIERRTADFPNYVVFYGQEKLQALTARFKDSFHKTLTLDKEIEPSFMDDILFFLNPRGNKNQSAYIYKIE